ncbi:MAG: hypothetical protein JO089_07035 [Alphaproteobacteria bacterium]|nr:hypothetical protein [Alphaproteobacteria bacterium]
MGEGNVLDEFVVILMQGKNTFGDRIFSYLKITLRDLKRMQAAVQAGQPFSPSDFGTVLAAGKGEPTPEQRAEISSMYKILDNKSESAAAAAPPPAPKAWDEY